MADNRYFFSDLDIIPGMYVAEGYAIINPGADWTIDEIFIGNSSKLQAIADHRAFALVSEALERDHSENITAEFGADLNAGQYLRLRDYGVSCRV